MRRIALMLAMTTALMGAGTLAAPALALDYPVARAYAPQQAAHQEVDYVWDFTNSCNNSIRLRLTAGVRNATSTSVFVEYVTVRYLPRTHPIRGGLIEVYAAGPESQTFRAGDFNDPPIPVGRVTERRWNINRTMTLQDGLALQVRKQIYPAIVYQGTCEFKYTMSARFAAHKTTCQDFVHGARQVSVCVHLFRAGIEWWAEGGMATNSGAVTMRLSALRLIADGSVRSELGQDIVQAGGHIQASTARIDLRALPAGRPVSGVIGFRMTWGDGTCYPLCSPPNSDFLTVSSTTT